MELFIPMLILTAIFFVILVAISRWVFRINDIVKRLDTIIERLGKEGVKI